MSVIRIQNLKFFIYLSLSMSVSVSQKFIHMKCTGPHPIACGPCPWSASLSVSIKLLTYAIYVSSSISLCPCLWKIAHTSTGLHKPPSICLCLCLCHWYGPITNGWPAIYINSTSVNPYVRVMCLWHGYKHNGCRIVEFFFGGETDLIDQSNCNRVCIHLGCLYPIRSWRVD